MVMLPQCLSNTRRLWLYRNGAYAFTNKTSRDNTTIPKDQVPGNQQILSFQWWKKKLTNVQLLYEEFTGLQEVRDAQNRVIDAEKSFILAQEKRRRFQGELTTLQRKLKEIYNELDKTPRGEDRYVHLITMEHSLIKEEKRILEVFQEKEREEREFFTALSSAVKMGHEKERSQAERTKYWSIIGSVFGTLLGMLASSIINDLRMKELRKLISKSVNQSSGGFIDYSEIISENENQLKKFVSSIKQLNESLLDSIKSENKNQLKNVVSPIKQLNESLLYIKSVRPESTKTELEIQDDSMLSTGTIASLILCAVVIYFFRH